jgi:cytochrome c oxidase assembly factor CtaG
MILVYMVLIYVVIATGLAPSIGWVILERCRDRGESWSTTHTVTWVLACLMWPVAVFEMIRKREQ